MIKFCGLTRSADAALASELGAGYVGAIFAEGPRRVSAGQAASVFAGAESGERRPLRVGVFTDADLVEIARIVREARLDVVQLHGEPDCAVIERVREETGAEVWAVVGIADAVPEGVDALLSAADAVVLDRRSDRARGGTGESFNWASAARSLSGRARRARLVVAGGLTSANVADAIRVLSPDVVDVASGVEASPGVKDPVRMRAFAAAVRGSAA